MLRVAIGPELALPSWKWVGAELARALAGHFQVQTFTNTLPTCDVMVVVKFVPSSILISPKVKILYFPIDLYLSPADMERDAPFLRRCAAIGCHSKPLMDFFKPYCKQVFLIEHHAKYALAEVAPYKEKGFALWVGAFEHVPYLLKWAEGRSLSLPLVLLSNPREARSWQRAHRLATRLQVKLQFSPGKLNGHALVLWSEETQRDLMQQAKAALDIKGSDYPGGDCWQQRMKPPTKGQQFVCSGIPFAINPGSYSSDYFQNEGFAVASPEEEARWLSYAYWEETAAMAARLKPQLTLDTIAKQVKAMIEEIAGKSE